MKFPISPIILGSAFCAAAAMPVTSGAQVSGDRHQNQTYAVVVLGGLGGTSSTPNDINDEGRVAGFSNLPGDATFHAFLWEHGWTRDLGTLGGPDSEVGLPGQNETGDIVGQADTSKLDPFGEDFCHNGTGKVCLGFIWRNGYMSPLPTLGGNNGFAGGVNNAGQIVGYAETATKDPNCIAPQVFDWEAVIWGPKKGQIQKLPPLAGDPVAAALAINDRGQVVGASGVCGNPSFAIAHHAVLWQNGSVVNLGSFGGTMNNLATAINNRGQVVGFSDLPGDTAGHAFLWQSGVLTDLGTLPGDFSSLAFGINNRGQVVGQSCTQGFTTCRAFLWQDGVMSDLNTLIPPNSKYSLTYGGDINDRGEIAAIALDTATGATPGVVLTPTGRFTAAGGHPVAKVILPEKVREQYQRRHGFGRF